MRQAVNNWQKGNLNTNLCFALFEGFDMNAATHTRIVVKYHSGAVTRTIISVEMTYDFKIYQGNMLKNCDLCHGICFRLKDSISVRNPT